MSNRKPKKKRSPLHTISIPEEVSAALLERAEREDKPVSRVVRRALEFYLGMGNTASLRKKNVG